MVKFSKLAGVAVLSGALTMSLGGCSMIGSTIENAAGPVVQQGLAELTRGVGELVLFNARAELIGGAAPSVKDLRRAAAVVVGDADNISALDPDAVVTATDINSGSRVKVMGFGVQCYIDVTLTDGDYRAAAPVCS